jgi:Maltose operon periplasmic protein precursor (MalM)
MNKFFTALRQRTYVRASARPRLWRFAASAATQTMCSAKCFRGIFTYLLVLGTIISIQGCAKPYGTVLRDYTEAPICCTSLADLPVEPLLLGDKKSFDLGTGSPVYQFDTGKSYFRAFALPQGPYPYRVTVRSFIMGDNLKSTYLFFPQLITLDEHHRLVRSTGPETFTLQHAGYIETMLETAGFRRKLEGGLTFTDKSRDEHFLVVLTTSDLLQGKSTVSIAGDEPMLNTITVAANGNEAQVSHAPAGRISISLTPLVAEEPAVGIMEGTTGRTGKEPSPGSHPEVVTVRLSSGKAIGTLELGRTTEETAKRLFEYAGAGLGPERRNSAMFAVGTSVLTPKWLFTPPGSSYQLYFDDNGTLVLFVDGSPANLPLSYREFIGRFPEARESGRTLGSHEIQVPLTQCVNLIAVFRTVSETLESAAYGYSCTVK